MVIERTTIEEIPGYTITKPIVVDFERDEGFILARARGLGLLVDGFGKTPRSAVDSLIETIRVDYENLNDPSNEVVGYAAFVKDRLREHMVPKITDSSTGK